MDKYQIFFDLRDKYPSKVKLISELLRHFFINKETFPTSGYIYLNGSYEEEDIELIFSELNLPQIECTFIRTHKNSLTTLVKFKD